MTHFLDIFRVETSGVLWVESAATMEDAKARVQELAVRSPAEYILLDQKTGDKLVIKPDGGYNRPLMRVAEKGRHSMSDGESGVGQWQSVPAPLQA